MKKIIAITITGLFFVCAAGIALAEGFTAGIDFQTEGPPDTYRSKKSVVPTVVVLDQGSPYIEGMGFTLRTLGMKTIVPTIPDRCDYCSEGLSEEEIARHFSRANKIEPAAGN